MEKSTIRTIAVILVILFLVTMVSAALPGTKAATRVIGRSSNVIDSVSQTKTIPVTGYKWQNIEPVSNGDLNISISISSTSGDPYCSYCNGWGTTTFPTYRFFINFPHGPTYYPDSSTPVEETRGWGSLVVTGPDNGITYYLWIKSRFFATDVWENYDMRWHYGGIIPVNYENNILEGTYCLKATTVYDSTAASVWCGTAVIGEGRTTSMHMLPASCPFDGCSC
jgi:hypothetical protein